MTGSPQDPIPAHGVEREDPGAAQRAARRRIRRLARTAWIWVALSPMGAAVGMITGAMAFSAVGGAPAEAGPGGVWRSIVVGLAAAIPALAAPLLGMRAGARAARAGSTGGLVAAVVSALILGMLGLWLVAGLAAVR